MAAVRWERSFVQAVSAYGARCASTGDKKHGAR